MYYKGQGVTQDYKKAYVWFSIAAKNGYESAVKARDEASTKLTSTTLESAQSEAAALMKKIEAKGAN